MKSTKIFLLAVFVLILVCINLSTAAVPVAQFGGTPITGSAPLTVTFTDQSTGTPTGWAWYFGEETYTAPWTQMTASAGWSPRYLHSSVVMPDGSIVMMGGFDWNFKNDVWRSSDSGATWNLMTPSGGWSPRGYHSSVVMPDGSIVIMGGGTYSIWTNDVWRSSDSGATWNLMTPSAGWSARNAPSSVVMPDGSIILTGGSDDSGAMNDVWRSTDNGATWDLVTPSAEWVPRAGHSSVVMLDGSIVLMGGQYSGGQKNDVWRSSDNGLTWNQMTASAGWSPRSFSGKAVLPDGSIIVMGGSDGGYGPDHYYNDVWRSIDKGATWTQTSANSEWSRRVAHSSVVMPNGNIVLFGGWDGVSPLKSDAWQLITAGSSTQNPSHTYTKPGIYNVALQVFNGFGYDSMLKTGYITVKVPTTNIPTKVKIVPNTINLGSKGYFLAFVTLPEAYKGATIDMKTVSCEGAPAQRMMRLKLLPRIVGFVFKTSDLQGVDVGKKVTLTLNGELKKTGKTYTFSGADSVKVISKPTWQPDDIKDISKLSDDQLFKKFNT